MGTDKDQRERAARLLKERHERESDTLAELMEAIGHRADAENALRTADEQITSRLAEMSKLGFDDEALAELGIDLAAVRATRASSPPLEAPAGPAALQGGPSGEADDWHSHERDGEAEPNLEATGGKHMGVVRTTAHLSQLRS